MGEVKTQKGQIVGGLPQAHPQEVQVRAQNAQRVARRRQAASLALEVGRTSGEDLDRFGERRRVGGRFERLQRVPKRKAPKRTGLQLGDLQDLIDALSFAPTSEHLGGNSFLSSFGPNILGLNTTTGPGPSTAAEQQQPEDS